MDELSAGIAQSRRTVALIKVRAHRNPLCTRSRPLKSRISVHCSITTLDVPRLTARPYSAEVPCFLLTGSEPEQAGAGPLPSLVRLGGGWVGTSSHGWRQRAGLVFTLTVDSPALSCRAQLWQSVRG